MKKTTDVIAQLAVGASLCFAALPVMADISYSGLYVEQDYWQTFSGSTFTGNTFGGLYLALTAPADYSSATVLTPTGTTLAFSGAPVLKPNGAYELPALGGYVGSAGQTPAQSLATLNATIPTGVYTFTEKLTNGSSVSSTMNYDSNHWPMVPGNPGQAAVPSLTAASYIALQGMNSASPHTFNFNTFTGDGDAVPTDPSPATFVSIYNPALPAGHRLIYTSPALLESTTSFLLPSKVLQPGTTYDYYIDFTNTLHCGINPACLPSGPKGSFLSFDTDVGGSFTTLDAAPPNSATVNLQGGTLASPQPLVSQGRVGQVDGSIGGNGSQDFYRFYWAGGTFQANLQVYGANSQGQYDFELLNVSGNLLEDVVLNSADGFSANLVANNLAAGPDYEIGLVADSPYDPRYSITLKTPVTGAPEPASLSLLAMGLLGVGLARRWRRS